MTSRHDGCPTEPHERLDAHPPVVGALDDRVDQRSEPHDRQQGTDRIERGSGRILGLREQHVPGDQRPGDDRDVDEEHRTPPELLEQQTRCQRTDRRPPAGDPGPDGDRLCPLASREHVGEDRQGRRHDERGTDPHHRPGGDQLARRVGEGAEQGSEGEDDEAELQRPLAPEAVTQRPGREQQAGEHQRIGVDDPLQVGVRCVQLIGPGERRQGHVEHRVADDDDDQRRAQNGEDLPPPGVDVWVDAVEVVSATSASRCGFILTGELLFALREIELPASVSLHYRSDDSSVDTPSTEVTDATSEE